MYESDEKISKWKIEVQVELDNGARLLGFLFVTPTQRLSDLLNDQRSFLPLQTADGLIVQLAKSTIAKVVQLDQKADAAAITDPYDILGVSPRVSDQKLKETYHALCTEYHPDKLLSVGVATEFIDLANTRITRIIDAYRRVQIMRRRAAGNGRNGQSGQSGKATADPVF
ncbi:MAG: DnaJ domain-containing protein [Proteobacteria bacterium]|nr:DnaJ domain-containing protein [Pseudomonadota bacterium]